jgi:hypothetical protein
MLVAKQVDPNSDEELNEIYRILTEAPMEFVFTIQLRASVKEKDKDAQDTLRRMVQDEAESLYTRFVLLSKYSPEVKVTLESDLHGEEDITPMPTMEVSEEIVPLNGPTDMYAINRSERWKGIK